MLFEDLLEKILVILPRVVRVVLDLIFGVVLGIFLSSFFFFISGLVILILLALPSSAGFFDELETFLSIKEELLLSDRGLILLISAGLMVGWVLIRLICSIFLVESWLRATLAISLALS